MIHKKENIYFKAILVLTLWFSACILAAVILSSCTVSKTRNKSATESDSTSKTASNTESDINTLTEERSTVKTTETFNAEVSIPGQQVSTSQPSDKLDKGDTISAALNGLSVKAFKDRNGNINLSAKTEDKKLNVKGDKTTESNLNSSKNERVKETKSIQEEAEISSKTVRVQATKVTNWFSPWWLLLLLIPLGYWAYKTWMPIKV